MRRFLTTQALAILLTALYGSTVWAGPPLVCHPLEIDGARSLPFGEGAYDTVSSYDRDQLTRDTLALLTPDTPVIVRMETLRRAVIYAVSDGAAKTVRSQALLAALMRRVLDAQATGKDDPLAWFDAGYAIETFKQTAYFTKWGNSPAFDLDKGTMRDWDGAAWVAHALAVRGKDPEMLFAMALIQAMRDRMSQNQSLRSAVDGATDGSLLAKNLLHHFGHGGESTLAELRAKL